MRLKLLTATFGTVALLTGAANALTLTNEDEAEYGVEVMLSQGDTEKQNYQLQGGGELADICNDGCTIKLENGAEQEFEGDEDVTIKDGKFSISE